MSEKASGWGYEMGLPLPGSFAATVRKAFEKMTPKFSEDFMEQFSAQVLDELLDAGFVVQHHRANGTVAIVRPDYEFKSGGK